MLDSSIHFPSNYDSMLPPAVGKTFQDPSFNTTIKRISDSAVTTNAEGGGNVPWITPEYATICPFNCDNSFFILIHQSYFGLYNSNGYVRDLPTEITASSEPRWDKAQPAMLYYVKGNQLKACDVTTGLLTIIHIFGKYATISGMGESDISADGNHFVFVGDKRFVFTFQISNAVLSPEYDTENSAFDSLYITPNNNVTITWNAAGSSRKNGIELFDKNMAFTRQVARAGGHMDISTDDDGSEILIWTNSNDPAPIANNAIVKINLATGQQTSLILLDWSLAVHISAADKKFALVETYAPANPNTVDQWKPMMNEVLKVPFDGSDVTRILHHRSRPHGVNTYNWQPKTSISHDGSLFVFGSNFNLQTLEMRSDNYSDVYLVAFDSHPQPVTPPINPVRPPVFHPIPGPLPPHPHRSGLFG